MTREDQLVHLSAAVLNYMANEPTMPGLKSVDDLAGATVEIAAKILERIERAAYRPNNYPG